MANESDKVLYDVTSTFPDPANQQAVIEGEFPEKTTPRRAKGRSIKGASPQQWLSQIEVCERAYQQQFNLAKRNIKFYKPQKSGRRVSIPLLTPLVEIKSAMATFRDPYISVRPRQKAAPTTPEELLAGAIKETYINWLWQELDLKNEIRRVVKDALLLTGRGITTPGYNMVMDPNGYISYETPIAYRTSPFDYLLDIEADSSRNAFYGIRRIVLPIPIAEAMFNKKDVFKPLRYSQWTRIKGSDKQAQKNVIKQYGRTLVYEVQDLLTNMFYFLTPAYSDFVGKFENPYPVAGLLPEFLEPMPVPDEIECIAESSLILPQLEELTDLRNFWMEMWKREIPKMLIEAGAATQDQIETLLTAEVMATAVVQNAAGIRPLEMPSGKAELQYHEERVRQDINDLSGFNEYLRGGRVPQTKTAFETDQIIQGANIRVSDLNDFVEKHCAKVARKLLAIATEFVSPQDFLAVCGMPADLRQMGLPQGIAYDEKMAKMDVEVTIHAGSMQIPNKSQDPQRAMLLQSFLAYPETDRFAVLQEMARMLDVPGNRIFHPPQAVDPEKQEEARMAQMTMGRGQQGQQAGGMKTGGTLSSRPRPELRRPA